MKLALSVFKDCISTVFDAADQLVILETDGANGNKRTMVRISTTDPANRATQIKDKGIDVLICGAISRPLQASIVALGIAVYPFVRGPVEEVIAAYQSDRLGQAAFSLPGCHGHGPGDGRGRGRGMRCPWRQTT
jgi:predicted Fe-Mo cluster-binding NifX family protein